MKKLFSLVVMCSGLVFFGAIAPASAYVPDGNLSEYGITPFTDWDPNAGVYITVEDNWNRQPESDPFNEMWDLEAFGFAEDGDYFNFFIVSSNSYTNTWAKEDVGIDLNNDGKYEYGLDVANIATNKLTTKNVYSVNSWHKAKGVPYRVKKGNKIGTYEIYNKYLGQIEGSWWKYTYVLEGRVSRLLFGDIACGAPIELLFSRVTCLKDWITVNGYCYGDCPPTPVIPEPATMLLLGSGLLGLGGLRFRRKKS
jgi:hypothetical protein